MIKLKLVAVTMVLIMGLASGAMKVEAVETSGSASVDVMSSYMWRGFELHEDMAIQPSVAITYGGFGANLWVDYNSDTSEVIETDLTLNYSFSIDKVGLDIGYIYYGLDGDETVAADTQEVYLSVSYDTILSPSVTYYYDFDEFEGGFLVASIGHDLELSEDISLSLGASASYNMDSAGEYTDLHNADISASLSIPLKDGISVAPMIAYSLPLSDEAEDALENADGDSSFFYGGANLSLSF